jgi:hypothetical protein
MTMCKLETMIYANEDGVYSVFTLNPNLKKQLADLTAQHPEICWRKMKDETTYQIKNAVVTIHPN